MSDDEQTKYEGATGDDSRAAEPKRMWGGRWEATSLKAFAVRGQGSVWRVRDLHDTSAPRDRQLYALKELRYPKPPKSTAYERFHLEIETTRRLASTHLGIVAVIDASERDTTDGKFKPYFVMPLAAESLDKARFLANAASLERVLQIGIVIADALIICHGASPSIVHRDVKPANVLLFGDSHEPRLADFGNCFLKDENQRLTKTEAGTVGSDGFSAPELEGGGTIEEVGPSADIYSLGKTLYAVISGDGVFPRESHRDPRFDLLIKHGDSRLAHLNGLLDHMSVARIENRYKTMAECRAQLSRALSNVQSGIAYQPGMYGGGETPRERQADLQRALKGSDGVEKQDSVRDAVTRAFDAASERAGKFALDNPNMTTTVGTIHQAGSEAAAEVAEHLLSVALPLIQSDSQDQFEEWLVRVAKLSEKDGYQFGERAQVYSAGAVLAAYGAFVYAWERRRSAIVGHLVRRHVEVGPDWIHLELLGHSAGRLLSWVATQLATSSVLSAELALPEGRLSSVVGAFSGLSAFADMLELPSSSQESLENLNLQEVDLPAYPACYAHNVEWANTLVETFSLSRKFESDVAFAVFGLTAALVRDGCRRMTPAMVMHTRQVLSEVRRHGGTGLGAEWAKWCNSQAPSPR